MPRGDQVIERPPPIKGLILGDSGAGKTGALASLAKAGYRLIIADFDNGITPLLMQLEGDKVALSNLYYEIFTNRMITSGGVILPLGLPLAFSRLLDAMHRWKFGKGDQAYNLGPISKWGPDTVFCLDSLTFFGRAAMLHTQAMNNSLGVHPHPGLYGHAMGLMEDYLALLYDEGIKCHVLVNSHILMQDDAEAESDLPTPESTDKFDKPMKKKKGVPMALGDKLPPKVGTYFNTCVRVKTRGRGASTKRVIRTTTEGVVGLKFPKGLKPFPDEVDISNGLARIFKYLRGGVEPSTTT